MAAIAAEIMQVICIIVSSGLSPTRLVLKVLYHGRNNRPVQLVARARAHTQLRSRLLPACLPACVLWFVCLFECVFIWQALSHTHNHTCARTHKHTRKNTHTNHKFIALAVPACVCRLRACARGWLGERLIVSILCKVEHLLRHIPPPRHLTPPRSTAELVMSSPHHDTPPSNAFHVTDPRPLQTKCTKVLIRPAQNKFRGATVRDKHSVLTD